MPFDPRRWPSCWPPGAERSQDDGGSAQWVITSLIQRDAEVLRDLGITRDAQGTQTGSMLRRSFT